MDSIITVKGKLTVKGKGIRCGQMVIGATGAVSVSGECGVKVGGVKIETVFKQLIAYFAAIFAVLMLVTYVPQISLALPSLMGYVK